MQTLKRHYQIDREDLLSSVPPLCVDLDGTLLKTDVLWESLLMIVKHRPWILLLIPIWFLRGRAYGKRRIAETVNFEPSNLPYNEEVLAFLHEQKQAGRHLILVTGSDFGPAQQIADHLGMFSQILASDGNLNLSGQNKKDLLVWRYGEKHFDYIGNSTTDLPVWSSARLALVVGSSSRLLARVAHRARLAKTFPTGPKTLDTLVQVFRTRQWVKNFLVFVPLIAATRFDTLTMIQAGAAFASFSLCASSLYILNDLFDLPADRRHPKKRLRPFASGGYPISRGLLWMPTLLMISFSLCFLVLPQTFAAILGLYAFTTIMYSFFIKPMPILDVITLAGLYTLRIFAGGIAVDISISNWLLAFSMFFFLSLAFGKRHSELQFRRISKHQGLERRGYLGQDKDALATMGTASGYLSVLIFALYLNSDEILSLFHKPQLLWLICPVLLYWISRTWLLANRGALEDDPLVIALNDPHSYAVIGAMGMLTLLAM